MEGSEFERITLLMMRGYGDRMRSYSEVADLFNEDFPNRTNPITTFTVARIVQRFNDSQSVKDRPKPGRAPSIDEEKSLDVMQSFVENQHLSTRRAALEHDISQSSVELYTHHNSMKKVMLKLQEKNFRLCTVHVVDSHYCSDPGKYISTLLLSMTAMLQMELPHINVLSKVDQVAKYADKLIFGLDYYTEVLNLEYLLDCLQHDPLTAKYKKLNAAIVSLVEDCGLVSFLPLSVKDKQLLLRVRSAVDRANGYVYGAGEERSVQALLACAVGAETETNRTGTVRDLYTPGDSCSEMYEDDATK